MDPRLIAMLAGAAALFSLGAYSGYRWELSAYNGLKAAQQTATAQAIAKALTDQKRADQAALDAAVADAAAQQKIVTNTVTIVKWRTAHVKDVAGCPGIDLVRLHDAAALGADPASLISRAGQSDDGAAGVTTSQFSDAITANYTSCLANAAQLSDLQAWVRTLPH